MLLTSCNAFSHIEKIATSQTLKNKIDELTDLISYGEFPSLSLESVSVATLMQCVCYLYEECSSVNELRYS